MRVHRVLPIAGCCLLAATAVFAGSEPIAVSPGDPSKLVLIADACPTFSWGRVDGARYYELVVYRLGKNGEEAQPVLRRRISGTALGWTPSLNRCLERGGRYAWSVRAVKDHRPGSWSEANLFAVSRAPAVGEVERALGVLRAYLLAKRESRSEPVTEKGTAGSWADTESARASDPGERTPQQRRRERPIAAHGIESSDTPPAVPATAALPPVHVAISQNSIALYSDNNAPPYGPALGVYSNENCGTPAPPVPGHAAVFAWACSDPDYGTSAAIGVKGVAEGATSPPAEGYGVYGEAVDEDLAHPHGVHGVGGSAGVFGISDWAHGYGGHFVNDDRRAGAEDRQVGIYVETYWGNIIEGYETMNGDPYRNLRFKVSRLGNVTADGTFQGGGADFAESVVPHGEEPDYRFGTVLEIGEDLPDGTQTFRESTEPYSTKVSGIVSTRPGFLGGRGSSKGLDTGAEIPMAMIGIVPCSVSAENGPIRRGDLLVSAATTGHAMKGTDPERMVGAVVAKALGELEAGTGRIDVLVTLQ